MHLYLDSADLTELTPYLSHPLIYGVTTNPTLMQRAGLTYEALPDFAAAIRDGRRVLQVQIAYAEAEAMYDHALSLAASLPDVIIKIPATPVGFAVAGRLKEHDIATTMTAVYEVEQALFARMVGARYAAPYLGRLNDSGRCGLDIIAHMQRVIYSPSLHHDQHDSQLLVASVRTREDVIKLLDIGVGALTIPPRLFPALIQHEATLEAEQGFLRDAQAC